MSGGRGPSSGGPGSQGLASGEPGGRGLVSRGAEAAGPGCRERPSCRKQPPRLPQNGQRLRTGGAGSARKPEAAQAGGMSIRLKLERDRGETHRRAGLVEGLLPGEGGG